MKNPQTILWILVGAGIIGLISFGGLLSKTLRLYLKYRDISKDIKNIGDALLKSLIRAGAIQTDESKLRVEATVDDQGCVYCHLEGGNTFDKSTFIISLQEIIGLIDNPRYVIIRKSRLMLLIRQKDFHSVPEVIGKKKEFAEYFKDQWTKLVGDCELIFTRNIEGRRLLLKSRLKSLSAQFEDKIEHVNKWR